jgi:hypothetical protein
MVDTGHTLSLGLDDLLTDVRLCGMFSLDRLSAKFWLEFLVNERMAGVFTVNVFQNGITSKNSMIKLFTRPYELEVVMVSV